uniref:Uncharacterized LOC111656478 n=1 Tax=Seriola lalandi dorsalis TaxID=1841481 RepID=A0A3B4YUQ3_SERLL
ISVSLHPVTHLLCPVCRVKLYCLTGTNANENSHGSTMLSSSISSRDVEHQFTLNPQGAFTFTVGSTSYRLDFSTMTQTNCITGLCRNVRRRPKFTSSTGSLYSTLVLPSASSSQLADGSYKWEFMGDEGEWTEYQICSFDSTAIETQYQLNPQGQLHFKIKRYSYTLDFPSNARTHTHAHTDTHTLFSAFILLLFSSSTMPRWQFQDIGGIWKDYSKGYRHCSISTQDIELQYQQDPSGIMRFTAKNFSYELDFSAMMQRNLSTCTARSVRRLNQ